MQCNESFFQPSKQTTSSKMWNNRWTQSGEWAKQEWPLAPGIRVITICWRFSFHTQESQHCPTHAEAPGSLVHATVIIILIAEVLIVILDPLVSSLVKYHLHYSTPKHPLRNTKLAKIKQVQAASYFLRKTFYCLRVWMCTAVSKCTWSDMESGGEKW